MTSSSRSHLRLAVFASGGGSNFQSIADAVRTRSLSLDLTLCVTNRHDAPVLDRAAAENVPTAVVNPTDYASSGEYVDRLTSVLDMYDVNFIALAGYLKKIPSEIVRRYRHRIVNIHPALLPAFGGKGMYGRRVHEAVLRHGVRWTGATVHLVDEGYDTGPIVMQEPVPVLEDDTIDELSGRVLAVEHRLYPTALQLFADGRIRVVDGLVRTQPSPEDSN